MTIFGTPIHPSLVHFPIAFFIGAWLLDCLSRVFKKEQFYTAAMILFVMAAVSSLVTGLTGLLEMFRLNLHHPMVYAHRNFALSAAVSAWLALAIIWMSRHHKRRARLIFTCACWLITILISVAAYLGGEMVYRYSVGVSA